MDFEYRAVNESDESDQVVNVFACHSDAAGILRGVMWSYRHQSWIYSPGIINRIVFDMYAPDRTRIVDRTAAESIAENVLTRQLPSESELRALIEEGERMGWDYGPPLTPPDQAEVTESSQQVSTSDEPQPPAASNGIDPERTKMMLEVGRAIDAWKAKYGFDDPETNDEGFDEVLGRQPTAEQEKELERTLRVIYGQDPETGRYL